MRIAHEALVVVADGRKLLMFRNEGDEVHPNLQLIKKEVHENPADLDQKSDQPGTTFSAGGDRGAQGGQATGSRNRSGYEETDYHQLEEDRFAAETADLLKARALAHKIDSLLIVAPPKTLGELRKHYHKEVEARLTGEIAKDLTGHPVEEIERIIVAAD